MGFFEDAIGNIGTFLGVNPDTKKKPQVVPPANTLRQQVLRPVQNVATPLQVQDNTNTIRQQAVKNNKAEEERKRQVEAARQAEILAQQQREKAQIAPVAKPIVSPLLPTVDPIAKIRQQAAANNQAESIKDKSIRSQPVSSLVAGGTNKTVQSLIDEYDKVGDLNKRLNYRKMIATAAADPNHPEHQLAVVLAPRLKNNAFENVTDFAGASNQAFFGGGVETAINAANYVGSGFNPEEAQRRTNEALNAIGVKDANGQSQLSKDVNRYSDASKVGEAVGEAQGVAVDLASLVIPGVAVEKALVNIPKVASWVDKGNKASRFLKSIVPIAAGGATSSAIGQLQDPTQNAGENFGIGLAGDFAAGAIGAGLVRIIGKVKAGKPLTKAEIDTLAKQADIAEAATKAVKQRDQAIPTPSKVEPEVQPSENPAPVIREDAPTVADVPPAIEYKPVSQSAVTGLTRGGEAAAVSILRATGRRLTPAAEKKIAQQLSYAKSPEEVTAVLKENGIPVQETPAEALLRQKTSGEQVVAEQAKALESAATPVIKQEAVPTAENVPQQTATPSADIAQNDVAPQVGKTDPQTSLTEARKTPIDQRTPEQTAEVTRLEAEVKTQKEASEFIAVQEKLKNGEPLTPKEERIYQKVMGTPEKKDAVKRATTPESQRPEPKRQPVNPAFEVKDDGTVKTIKKRGKAADNQAQSQQAFEADAAAIKGAKDDLIRPVENLIKEIEQQAPSSGKVLRDLSDDTQAAVANQTRKTNDDIDTVDEIFAGKSKQDMDGIRYAVENFSNKKVMAKFKAEYPEAYASAQKVRDYLDAQLVEINKVLKDYGEKEIGKIEDYFPRMRAYLDNPKSKLGDLLREQTQNATFGDARINKSFQKHRTMDEAFGKQANPYDTMMAYARQSNTLIHRLPVIKRIDATRQVFEAVKGVPESAQREVGNLFKTVQDQLTNANTPKTRMQKIVNALTGISSQSGIAGSANTLLTQIASQVPFYTQAVVKSGIFKGTADLAKFQAYALMNLKKAGKNARDMAQIDGMESDYLINAIGTKSSKKDVTGRIKNAAFRASSLGDIQFRAASVRTLYERAVKEGAPRGKATLLKAEADTKLALQDRSAGARSRFTSSGNAAARLASQYQIEQIGQVYTYIDGVLRNPAATPARKFFATLAAVSGAAGVNATTGALSGGTVKPTPDIIGAAVEAHADVQQQNEDRIANGEEPYTDAQLSALFFSNTASNFISNLPLGRTGLSVASAATNALTNDKNTASNIGLNPKDTNPFQTLPAISTVVGVGKDVADVAQGNISPVEGTLNAASRVVPGGGQIKRTTQGITTFVNGGDSYYSADPSKPGDVKFTVNNDLSTPEGIKNLTQSVLFGKYATQGGQDYIKSGFKTQSERDVRNKTYSAQEVLQLSEDQTNAYEKAVKSRFGQSLTDKEKSLYKFVTNSDEVNRQIEAGKLTDAEVQDLKAKMNKNLFDNGLGYKIDNGFNKDQKGREQFKSFTPEVQDFVTRRSIETSKAFKDQEVSKEAESVISQATSPDELWPTITDVKPTNSLAGRWVDYQKALSEAGNDQSAQFTARKKFWSSAVKQNFDSKAVGIYDSSDDGGTTNAKSTYGMSIANIKKLASPEGLTVGKENYKINKRDLDSMVELDNRLLKAGLITKPKFSNKTRGAFGYGDAPLSEVDGLGYTDAGSGRKGSDRTGVGTLLTDFGGRASGGFKLDIGGKGQRSAPNLDIAQYQNKGKRAGKSSITIKL